MTGIDTIYNEDCLEDMKRNADRSVDCIICNLPYGTTSCRWDSCIPFDKLWEQYQRIVKPRCAIVLFGQEPFSTYLRMSNIDNYKYDWVWNKNAKGGFLNAKKRPLKQTENISVFLFGTPVYHPQMQIRGKERNKASYNKRKGNGDMVYGIFNNVKTFNNVYYPSNLVTFSNALNKGKLHPTQKPIDLLAILYAHIPMREMLYLTTAWAAVPLPWPASRRGGTSSASRLTRDITILRTNG